MKMMTKRWIAPAAILLLTLCALPAFAADATGKWTGQAEGPDANVLTLIFVFKQEGTHLTGTLTIKDDSDKIRPERRVLPHSVSALAILHQAV